MSGNSETILLKLQFALLCSILIFSCESAEKPPKDILSKDQMANILSDVHIAEARISQMHLKSMDSSVVIYDYLQKKIYKKYQTDSSEYKKSYNFYASNPESLEEIYNLVTKKIAVRAKKNNIKL
jgi:ferritin-like metal-binding protein YciE